MSSLEILIGVQSYAQRLQTAAKTLIEYFTPRSAEEIKDGHRVRSRGHWRARQHPTRAQAKRLHLRRITKAARRVRAKTLHRGK